MYLRKRSTSEQTPQSTTESEGSWRIFSERSQRRAQWNRHSSKLYPKDPFSTFATHQPSSSSTHFFDKLLPPSPREWSQIWCTCPRWLARHLALGTVSPTLVRSRKPPKQKTAGSASFWCPWEGRTGSRWCSWGEWERTRFLCRRRRVRCRILRRIWEERSGLGGGRWVVKVSRRVTRGVRACLRGLASRFAKHRTHFPVIEKKRRWCRKDDINVTHTEIRPWKIRPKWFFRY